MGVLHLANVYHAVASVDDHVYLRTPFAIFFCAISPRIDIRKNSGYAKRTFNLIDVQHTDALKGESAPAVGFRLVERKRPVSAVVAGAVSEKAEVKKREIVNQLVHRAFFEDAVSVVAAQEAAIAQFLKTLAHIPA